MALMLAETISFSDEEIMFYLLVLLAMLMTYVVVTALGCVWAWKAGRGSQPALVGWVLVGSMEVVLGGPGLFGALVERGVLVVLALPMVALGVQVALFLHSRGRNRHRSA